METIIALAFLGVAAMIACLFFITRPLWLTAGSGTQSGRPWRASTVWSDWIDQKETLLFNLEDLEHEQHLGKISAEDFGRLQSNYKKQLIDVMDQMDHSAPPKDFEAFLLQAASAPSRGTSNKQETQAVCFSCKAFYEKDFKFCPRCGATLTVQS